MTTGKRSIEARNTQELEGIDEQKLDYIWIHGLMTSESEVSSGCLVTSLGEKLVGAVDGKKL